MIDKIKEFDRDEKRRNKYEMRASIASTIISTGFNLLAAFRPDKIHKISVASGAIGILLQTLQHISEQSREIDNADIDYDRK